MPKKELHIKSTNSNEKQFIGLFDSDEAISAFLAQLYNIVTLNDQQHLLIINEFNKEGDEVASRHFIGCFESKEVVQTFLNDSHEIIESDTHA